MATMATPTPYLTCPLCGFAFDRRDTLCRHGCPLETFCRLVRCPSCAYEFPGEPQSVSWLKRLLGGAPARPAGTCATLSELAPGDDAEVLQAAPEGSARAGNLAVFGLVPGAELTLLQRRPSYVVRVGETELALGPEIAAEILVRRSAAI
jgi:Fe2+ transport system protein FeoA